MRAPLPADEAARLTSLHGYEILDTPPEQVFEDLVRLASTVSGMPVALISFVDAERQWFKARLGLDFHETPRELSFCSHAILEDGVFVVEDASRDPRFADNPYVTGDPRIRFYAGAPIRTHDGHSLGTVCVLGQVPSSFRPEQRRALSELAALVADQLEQRAAARKLRRELALSAARLQTATDSLPFGLWMRDLEHRCVLQNPVARAHRGDLLGTRPQEADVPAELKQLWEEEGRRALAGESCAASVSKRLPAPRGSWTGWSSRCAMTAVSSAISGSTSTSPIASSLRRHSGRARYAFAIWPSTHRSPSG